MPSESAERRLEWSRSEKRRQNRADFQSFDRKVLLGMDDKTLAEWQSKHEPDEPAWRLAEHEWQRRIASEQIRATVSAARWQAWFAIFGAIIGAALAKLGSLWL